VYQCSIFGSSTHYPAKGNDEKWLRQIEKPASIQCADGCEEEQRRRQRRLRRPWCYLVVSASYDRTGHGNAERRGHVKTSAGDGISDYVIHAAKNGGLARVRKKRMVSFDPRGSRYTHCSIMYISINSTRLSLHKSLVATEKLFLLSQRQGLSHV
jgi:hypothetical protein